MIPSQQRAANTTGLTEIADLIQYYNAVEHLYRQDTSHRMDANIMADFETKLTRLYSLILEYQAQTIRQLSANLLIKKYGKSREFWDNSLTSIRAAHALCKERLDFFDRSLLKRALEAQESRISARHSEMLQRLDIIQDTGNEILNLVRG